MQINVYAWIMFLRGGEVNIIWTLFGVQVKLLRLILGGGQSSFTDLAELIATPIINELQMQLF